jgi:hypothetical protein
MVPRQQGKTDKDFTTSLLLSVFAFLLIPVWFSFVTDDYAYFMGALAAKQFGDFAYFDVHFQGFVGIREIYKLFYHFWPQINWHYVYALFFEFLSLFLLLDTLSRIILANASTLVKRSIQILVILIYIENIAFVSHTRVSIIFCGLALINLLFAKELRTRALILNSILFILGLLLRSESAIGATLLVSAGYLIYAFRPLKLIGRIWLPALSIFTFISIFYIDRAYTDIYNRKIEPDIEYKIMARHMVPLSTMGSDIDSVKYEAATVGMWFDTKEMSPEFMRSLLLPGIAFNFSQAKLVFNHVTSFYKHYLFVIPVLAALLLFVSLFAVHRKIILIRMMLIAVVSFALIYILDINGLLVSYRHFLSLQLLSLMLLLYCFFSSGNLNVKPSEKWLIAVVLSGVIWSILATVYNYKQKNTEADEITAMMEQTMKAFEGKYSNKIVAATIDNRFMFDRKFSLFNQMYHGNTYLMFDWFTFPLTPRYVSYLSRTCQCNAEDPVEFFKWLGDKNALYLSVPYRYN